MCPCGGQSHAVSLLHPSVWFPWSGTLQSWFTELSTQMDGAGQQAPMETTSSPFPGEVMSEKESHLVPSVIPSYCGGMNCCPGGWWVKTCSMKTSQGTNGICHPWIHADGAGELLTHGGNLKKDFKKEVIIQVCHFIFWKLAVRGNY